MISRLASLMGEKQARENRIINAITLAEETGISKQTIYNWLTGNVRRFDEPVIVALCKYFSTKERRCEIGDLLYIDWSTEKAAEKAAEN